MQNFQHPSSDGQPEPNNRLARHLEAPLLSNEPTEGQQMIEHLIDTGFDWEEAIKLIQLREHLYENPEMRQRVAEDSRMHFARWLYENGEIGED
jgi:hypothetical protein